MRDPHVVLLRYRMESSADVTFENPPAIERTTKTSRLRLEGGTLAVEMLEHFATEPAAREAVEPYLRAWEMQTALEFPHQKIAFTFDAAEIIDRDPPPPPPPLPIGSAILVAPTATATATALSARFHVTLRSYPEPPDHFTLSPNVETMWFRYQLYREGREPLASMAYACLSLLEGSLSRKQAAEKYSIDLRVLNELGRLVSSVGDGRTARKLKAIEEYRPHTPAEVSWIDAVIRGLIRRVGEYEADPDARLPKLTMDDFPLLPG